MTTRFVLTLPDDLSTQERAGYALVYLEALVRVDRGLIARGLVPPLYSSHVRYRLEPPGTEEFADALTCYRRGWGDCDDLAAWRCAELQHRGVAAHVALRAEEAPRNRPRLIHVVVRLPNGDFDDPSRELARKEGLL